MPRPEHAAKAAPVRSATRSASVTPPTPTVSAPTDPPPVGEAPASAPAAAAAAAGASDGGLLARQVGEMLGARSAAPGGRVSSVSPTAPAGPAEAGRRESSGSSRSAPAPKPPPGRPQTTGETMRGRRGAFDRLVRSIRMQLGPRVSTARLQLTPPELGRVRVDVRVTQQRMELSIQTQTPEAREVLASRLVELRAALADQGLTLERCEVTLPSPQDALARGGGRDAAGRGTGRDVPAASDTRPRAGDESSEGEDTDFASTEATEGEGTGAASEMRLDIRV
jgi:flagellar hook-length control protein FliK